MTHTLNLLYISRESRIPYRGIFSLGKIHDFSREPYKLIFCVPQKLPYVKRPTILPRLVGHLSKLGDHNSVNNNYRYSDFVPKFGSDSAVLDLDSVCCSTCALPVAGEELETWFG